MSPTLYKFLGGSYQRIVIYNYSFDCTCPSEIALETHNSGQWSCEGHQILQPEYRRLKKLSERAIFADLGTEIVAYDWTLRCDEASVRVALQLALRSSLLQFFSNDDSINLQSITNSILLE